MRANFWGRVFGGVASLTVLCTVAMARPQPPLSQQDATKRAVVLLTGFGISGPVRVVQSGRIVTDDARPTMWDMSLVDGRKQTYRGLFFADSRVSELSRTEEKRRYSGWKSRTLTGPRYEQLARRWLAVTGTKEATQLVSLSADNKGIGHAYFRILRNGYPFVSHSRYGYSFSFDVATGAFIEFRAEENPPAVAPGKPKLSEKAALDALKRIWDTKWTTNLIRKFKWRRTWYKLTEKPELGYYLPEGTSTAILVWRIPYMSYRDVGHAIQGGSNGMLIDAVTGDEIPTATVP